MRFSHRTFFATSLVLAGLAGGLVFGLMAKSPAEEPKAKANEPITPSDEAAVHKALETFASAFNESDSKKIAATLTANAEFIDESSSRIEGATAISEMLGKFCAVCRGAKIQFTPEGTRTIAPGVVVEDGESVVTVLEKKTQSVRKITVVYAKVEGAWKIASIREYPEESEVVTAEERLQQLSWFLGAWMDEGGGSLVENTVALSADKTHLVRDFTVRQKGDELLKGMQRIGIDPLTGNIKGWAFDSAGGRGESTWTRNGDEWLVRSSGVTSEGEEFGATYIFKPLSKDRIQLNVVHKVVGNTVEDDSTTILVRKAPVQKK
jgi:uncharacterized protein (TIGR02246 family)